MQLAKVLATSATEKSEGPSTQVTSITASTDKSNPLQKSSISDFCSVCTLSGWIVFFFLASFLSFSKPRHDWYCHRKLQNEPPHDKTNKMTCAPSEASDQPGHPPSLISPLCSQWVAKDPSFLYADSEDPDQSGRMPRLISLRWAHMPLCCFFSCGGSNVSFQRATLFYHWIAQSYLAPATKVLFW